MNHIIDWNEIWKLGHSITSPSSDPWKTRAEHFERHTKILSWATDEMISRFQCKPTDTVLDIGAGTGRYAIPIAKQVASLTAIEPSATMRTILEKKQAEHEISNMVIIPRPWEHITVGKDIQPHDIVIASHSFTMHDVKEAIVKMHQAAKREFWFILFAGQKMESWVREALIKAKIDAGFEQRPFDYLIIYSILHSLEIYADVNIYAYEFFEMYPDRESAVQDWRLMYDVPLKNEIFTQEILSRLICTDDGYALPRTSRVAAIHWHVHSTIHHD
jgi:SAM-dependent methyltransferase